MCCPFPTQPGHPVVRRYLSRIFCRKYTLFRKSAAFQLIFLLDRWSLLRALCCGVPRTANTQIQELQVPSSVTFKTPHATCFHCSCWRQQQEFIGAVKLADKNLSHPPHILFGPIFRMVSSQAHPCPGKNDEAFFRFPSLESCLQPMHNVVPSSPSKRDPVQLLSRISLRRLPEMPEAVPELSNSLVLNAPSSIASLLALQSQSELWIDTV